MVRKRQSRPGGKGLGLGSGPHTPGQQPPQARGGGQGRDGAAKVTARQPPARLLEGVRRKGHRSGEPGPLQPAPPLRLSQEAGAAGV